MKSFRLASLSNFHGLWATVVFPSFLAPGLKMVKEEESCLGVRARQRRYGFRLVSLHIKDILLARSFAISKN